MRVLATGSKVFLEVRPTSTLSGARLPLAGDVPNAPDARAPDAPPALSTAFPVAGVACAAPVAGAGCAVPGAGCAVPVPGDAIAPALDVWTLLFFAVRAARLSAARLSLASSIV